MTDFSAQSDLTESYTPEVVLLDDDAISKPDTIAQAGVIASNTVLGRVTASGKLIKSVSTAADGSESPVAILVNAVDATAADVVAPVWVAGVFNVDALVFDASFSTDATKLAAFGDLSPVVLKKPIYSVG